MTREVLARAAPAAPPSTREIEVVLSDRIDDVEQTLSVVHDGFVEAGYMSPQDSGLRMHRAYLNPGTVFAHALVGGEPIGSAVLVMDGPFGLPSDRAFTEENDRLRRERLSPVLECGSFAVPPVWRRHTRRVFVRIIAALVRAMRQSLPDSPVVISVTPAMERFYRSTLRLERLSGVRPLFGEDAIHLCTPSIGALVELLDGGENPIGRAMSRLLGEEHASWVTDRRAGRPFPGDWLRRLDDEQGVMSELEAQMRFLAAHHPDLLRSLMRAAAIRAA